jgi:hypothetical protein
MMAAASLSGGKDDDKGTGATLETSQIVELIPAIGVAA